MNAPLTYGSVCSGIEAATVAWASLGWTPAFFAEIEKFPSAVLAHHYGSNMPDQPHATNGVPNYGDMNDFKEWPDHGEGGSKPIDLLVGGTPCQSFSIAGLRAGLADPRGNLMLTYLAVLARYRPRWCIWENVPGVLSSNGGRDFGTFLGGLVELGYGFAYRVLDAQYCRAHGFENAVPQRRRRVFVIGCLGNWAGAAQVLFDGQSLRGDPAPRRKAGQKVAHAISARPSGGGGLGTDFDLDGGLIPDTCGTLSDGAHNGGGMNGQDAYSGRIIPVSKAAQGFTQSSHGQYTPGCGPVRTSGGDAGLGSETLIAFSSKDHGGDAMDNVSPTLRSMGHHKSHPNAGGQVAVAQPLTAGMAASSSRMPHEQGALVHEQCVADVARTLLAKPNDSHADELETYVAENWAVRRLTPIECERLQGFGDNYTRIPWRNKVMNDCPDGPRYKALGNSVAINAMRIIGERIAAADAQIKAFGAAE